MSTLLEPHFLLTSSLQRSELVEGLHVLRAYSAAICQATVKLTDVSAEHGGSTFSKEPATRKLSLAEGIERLLDDVSLSEMP